MNPLIVHEWRRFVPIDIAHATAALCFNMRTVLQHTPQFCTRKGVSMGLHFSKNTLTFDKAYASESSQVLQLLYEKWSTNAPTKLETDDIGNASLSQHRTVQSRLDAAFESCNFLAFRWATALARKGVIEFFVRHFDQTHLEQAFEACEFEAFRSACTRGHISILEFFAQQFDQPRLEAAFEVNNFKCFYLASYNDDVTCLEFFARQFDQARLETAFKVRNFKAFRSATTWGNHSVLNFFASLFDQSLLDSARF